MSNKRQRIVPPQKPPLKKIQLPLGPENRVVKLHRLGQKLVVGDNDVGLGHAESVSVMNSANYSEPKEIATAAGSALQYIQSKGKEANEIACLTNENVNTGNADISYTLHETARKTSSSVESPRVFARNVFVRNWRNRSIAT
jgi:hypothetical protein